MLPLRFGPSPSARPYPSTVTFAFFRSFRQKFMSTKVQDAWDDIEPNAQDGDLDCSRATGPNIKKPVRDDWDNDEDEDESNLQQAVSGLTVKDTADESVANRDEERKPSNVKSYAAATSGNVVTSKLKSTPIAKGYSVQSSSLPPEMSFEPSIRIMKRPQQPSRRDSGSQTPNSERQTIQEREEKYRKARERIFGSSTSSSDSLQPTESPKGGNTPTKFQSGSQESDIARSSTNEEQNKPLREPLGPDSRPAFKRKPQNKVATTEKQSESIN